MQLTVGADPLWIWFLFPTVTMLGTETTFTSTSSESEKLCIHTSNLNRTINIWHLEGKMNCTQTLQTRFPVYRFISPQALHLLILTFKPCRHHGLVHAAKINKCYSSTKKQKRKRRGGTPLVVWIIRQGRRSGAWCSKCTRRLSTCVWQQGVHTVHYSGSSRGRGTGGSNSFVGSRQRWWAAVTATCSPIGHLSSGPGKLRDWFPAALGVRGSPAETHRECKLVPRRTPFKI